MPSVIGVAEDTRAPGNAARTIRSTSEAESDRRGAGLTHRASRGAPQIMVVIIVYPVC
jgi:hypothetical protein